MSKNKKVLFFAPYSGPWAWFLHTRIDAVVATSLQIRGCDVLVVGCDGIYQDCYIIRLYKPYLKYSNKIMKPCYTSFAVYHFK